MRTVNILDCVLDRLRPVAAEFISLGQIAHLLDESGDRSRVAVVLVDLYGSSVEGACKVATVWRKGASIVKVTAI